MSWSNLDDRRDLRVYLGIKPEDDSEDAVLQPWFESAITKGDLYLENPFTDDLGADLPFPEPVRVGVWEYVKALRERHDSQAGVVSVKTGQLSETRGLMGIPGGIAFLAAKKFWWPFKLTPLLAGAL
jgi:hypothetical protein